MKKVLKKLGAVIVAVSLLSITAMATDIKLDTNVTTAQYGDTLYLVQEDFGLSNLNWEFNDDYFSISKKQFTQGANLVNSVEFDVIEIGGVDTEVIAVELDKSNSVADVKSPNLRVGEFTIRAKQDSDDAHFEYRDEFDFNSDDTINIIVENIVTSSNSIDLRDIPNGQYVDVSVDNGYTEAEFYGGDVIFYGRVYDGDVFKIDYDEDYYSKDILVANPKAEIEFYNVSVTGVSSAFTIEIIADEDSFVYELKDGKLYDSNLEWGSDWSFSGKTRTGAVYVVSDIELDNIHIGAVDTEDVKNPDTGVSDFIGLAMGLATVSLVGAYLVVKRK